MTRGRSAGIAALLALAPALGLAKDLQLASVWASAPVKTDGNADAWTAVLKPLGDLPVVIGVQNDGTYLYLCVKTSDLKTIKSLKAAGLTVWANGDGKTERAFGVRFPVRGGAQAMHARGGPEGAPGGGDQPPAPSGDDPHATGSNRRPAEFELIGPTAEDRLRIQPADDEPVVVALGDDAGVTVLEYRIPLNPSELHPLAVGAAPGATIALGLETEKPKPSEGHSGRGGGGQGGEGGEGPPGGPGGGYGGHGGGWGGAPGGMGGGYGGGHHGMGGGMHEGGHEMMGTPVKQWLKVTLATPPAALPAK